MRYVIFDRDVVIAIENLPPGAYPALPHQPEPERGAIGDRYNSETDTFEPYGVVPKEVTRRQFIDELIHMGIDDLFEKILDQIEDPTEKKLARNSYNAERYERDSPLLANMVVMANQLPDYNFTFTDEDIDQLFIRASKH